MNIAICDDDIEYIDVVKRHLERLRIKYDVFMSGEALLEELEYNESNYDAVFLDMEMEKLNGIDVGNQIRRKNIDIIIVFVTNYSKYMQKSFECQPFRFLLKPLKFEECKNVCDEIYNCINTNRKIFLFSEDKKKMRIRCNDVVYFESSKHWILIHLLDGTVHRVRKTMTELLEVVDENEFTQTHRSFVINLAFVHQISDNEVLLYNCETAISISRTFKKQVADKFIDYKERRYHL